MCIIGSSKGLIEGVMCESTVKSLDGRMVRARRSTAAEDMDSMVRQVAIVG